MAEHSVLEHLGLAARDYDAAIRRYIPEYEEMIGTVIALVGRLGAPFVIDMGAGTGALGAAIAARVPSARVRLLDIDPAMLEVARTRVAEAGRLPDGSERVECVVGRFEDALPPCDAVVASLAFHHVPERADKTALYRRVHQALRPGGVLLIADATVHETGPERAWIYETWAEHMAAHAIARPEAEQLFAQWALEDRYYPLEAELSMLREAGFARPECFWKHGPMTVYGGMR